MQVDLVPMEILRPHELTIPKKVDELEKMTHRWKAYVLQIEETNHYRAKVVFPEQKEGRTTAVPPGQ